MTGRSLLDTSVLIAPGDREALELPEEAAISVVTLGELRAGVLRAKDPAARGLREARLAAIRESFLSLPIDATTADRYGELLALARTEGRSEKSSDLLIIATASVGGRTLCTLDQRQSSMAQLAQVAVLEP